MKKMIYLNVLLAFMSVNVAQASWKGTYYPGYSDGENATLLNTHDDAGYYVWFYKPLNADCYNKINSVMSRRQAGDDAAHLVAKSDGYWTRWCSKKRICYRALAITKLSACSER